MNQAPIFNLNIFWTTADPDGEPCLKCEERIYGTMWHQVVQFAEEEIEESVFTPIENRLCDPCYKVHILGE